MSKRVVKTAMEFDVPARDVWEAITNSSNFKKWYFQIPHFSTEVGATFEFYDSESKTHFHRCQVLECIPGQRFVHSWQHPNESKGNTVVTWEITSLGEHKSKLELTHEGLENLADGGSLFSEENFQAGWNYIIQTSLRHYLYLIDKLHFSININAPQQVVWDTMWNQETFARWTELFCPGSSYKGTFDLQARIHFLDGQGGGMYSNVITYEAGNLIVFEHIGDLVNGKETPLNEESKRWTGCRESYRLMEINETTTELEIAMDVTDSHCEFMKKHFPLGLEVLKDLCEANAIKTN